MASRRDRILSIFPDQPTSGIELNPERGYFSIIIPEATTNIVIYPSGEGNVNTNYIPYNFGSNILGTAWQAHGVYGWTVTPNGGTEDGIIYGDTSFVALTAGTTYTASVTLQGEKDKIYYIWFATTASALVGSKRKWIATGFKQRIHVTMTEPTGANRRVIITRDAKYVDKNPFYVDGLQVEAKSYPTTYCDGDQVGFLTNETPVPYLWNGTVRASSSSRSALTRSGGREVSLLSLGFHVLAVVGLGMAGLVDQFTPIPGFGELPQGTGTAARTFNMVGALIGEGDGPRHLQALRSNLIDVFKPDLTVEDQPLILRYQALDDDGDPIGECLDIICKYRAGLEGNWDNNQQERMALQFKMYLPHIQNTYSNGVNLGFQTLLVNANALVKRDTLGVWSVIPGFLATTQILTITPSANDSIYIGGTFLNAGANPDNDFITRWNGSALTPLSTGLNDVASATLYVPPQYIYIGGAFTNAGDANGDGITMWDGTNFNSLSIGLGPAGAFSQALAMAATGHIIIGGVFTAAGGVASNNITQWNGSAFYGMNGGVDAEVKTIASSSNTGDIFVGGLFHHVGPSSLTVDHIAQYNISTALWSGMDGGVDGDVFKIIVVPDGKVYAFGNFTHAGRVGGLGGTGAWKITANYAAVWNGVSWSAMGSGLNNYPLCAAFGPDGNLYVGGYFTVAGGITVSYIAMWTGSTWVPLDIQFPGVAYVQSIAFDKTGNLYIGIVTVGGTALTATVTVPNIGSATAYPVFEMIGPGSIYQIKNYSTGRAIYFNLTLLAGERAVLDLRPDVMSFISNMRGSLLSTILKGSNMDFPFMPGANNISAYFFGTVTASTKITASWYKKYWSIDGATIQ